MKRIPLIIALVLLFVKASGLSQGFVNLDFDSGNLSGCPVGSVIPATNAFPGWTLNAGVVLYDTISLSGGSISLMDSNGPAYFPTMPGAYFALLESVNYLLPGAGPISIGQTGQIPLSAKSITFWGQEGGMQITFNGQPLSFVPLVTTANYSIYGADISEYAGQTGDLLFTEPTLVSAGMIDNLQISPAPIPEPDIFALSAVGGLMLACRRWWKSKK